MLLQVANQPKQVYGLQTPLWTFPNMAFDILVQRMQRMIVPEGYSLTGNPPESLDQLNACYDGTGPIPVSCLNSDKTIYHSRDVNYAFRAWHDWVHWKYQYPFDFDGEYLVAGAMMKQVGEYVSDPKLANLAKKIIFCEVVGQAMYYHSHDRFPEDQKAFTLAWFNMSQSHALMEEF